MADIEWGTNFAEQASKQADNAPDGETRDQAYSVAFAEIAKSSLSQRGVQLSDRPTPAEQAELLRKSVDTELLESLANKNSDSQLDALRNFRSAGFPPVQAAQDVAWVIGKFKRVDPRTIAAADPLTKYRFQDDEKRAMAILLDDFYLSKGLKMDKQIQPWETQPATHVASFIAVVVAHNPHR